MIKIGFGSRIKPRMFDYVPRYYDPAKEEFQERLKMYIESEEGVPSDLDKMKIRIKSKMRMKHNLIPSERSKAVKKSNIRLVYILIALLLITYFILSSGKIISLIEMLSR